MDYIEYNEKRKHGESDFPIQLYYTNEKLSGYIMPPHWHKELEIIRMISGEFDIYINNMCYSLKKGDIFFVNCKFLHRGIPQHSEYECLLCDLDMMAKSNYAVYAEYINPIIVSTALITPVLHADGSALYGAVEDLFAVLRQKPPHYKLGTMRALFNIFELLYTEGKIENAIDLKKSFDKVSVIAQLIRWIENNCAEKLTLEMLAQRADMTPNYFCKIFKDYTGKTPTQYINMVRVDNACRLLPSKSVTEAALESGFSDSSYFCKTFKKIKGISPIKYKKGRV